MSAGVQGSATLSKPAGNTIWLNTTPTNLAWATLLLKDIGAPTTPNNLQNVLKWIAFEKGRTTWADNNNPLSASLNAQKINGVSTYPDLTTAARQTATMIVQGNKGGAIGPGIYTSLMNNAPTAEFSTALAQSAWDANHYGVSSAGSNAAVPGRLPDFLTSVGTISVIAAGPGVDGGAGIPHPAGVSGCASKDPIVLFNTPGSSITGAKIQITGCQRKAIIGGLAIFFGGGLMLGGLFILSSSFAKSAIGKQVGGAINNTGKVIPPVQKVKAAPKAANPAPAIIKPKPAKPAGFVDPVKGSGQRIQPKKKNRGGKK